MTARRVAASLGLVAVCLAVAVAGAGASGSTPAASAANGCQLKSQDGAIEHVIFIDFDNTHLTRDNPNVKSDLEQMPHLLDFLKGQGTVSNKHHTVLISHTAAGILTALTGLYPDRMGATVTNSYDYYNPLTGKASFTSAFKYWTAPVVGGIDDLPNMVNGDSGTPKTTPAPWVTFTRAGCDVGQVSFANTVLENNNSIITPQTSLALDAPSGALNIKVASVAPFRPGLTVQIDNEFVGPIETGRHRRPRRGRPHAAESSDAGSCVRGACSGGRPDRRHDDDLRQGHSGVERGEGVPARAVRLRGAGSGPDRLRGHRRPLLERLVERVHEHVGPAEREDRPAPGRAGRLQRLPGAVRCEVREPGDHEGIGRRQGRLRHLGHRGRVRYRKASPASTACRRLLRSATSPRCRRRGSRSRTPTSRMCTTTTPAAARTAPVRRRTSMHWRATTTRSRSSSTASPRTASTRATRCSSLPPTRTTTSRASRHRAATVSIPTSASTTPEGCPPAAIPSTASSTSRTPG